MRIHTLIALLSFVIGCQSSAANEKPADDDDGSSETRSKKSSKKKKKKKDQDGDEGENAPATATSSAAPAAPSGPAEDPFVVKHIQLLEQAGACNKGSRLRLFCPATKFGSAGAIPPPPKASAHLGLSLFVSSSDASEAALDRSVHVASLAFNSNAGGARAFISGIKPDNERERAELKETRAEIEAFALGGAKPRLSNSLADYLESLPARAQSPMRAHPRGFHGDGGDIRFVGDAWVTVEVDSDRTGVWISVFPRGN